jgi:hypothetical protein
MIYEYRSKKRAWWIVLFLAFDIYAAVMVWGTERSLANLALIVVMGVGVCAGVLYDALKIRQVRTDDKGLTVERRFGEDLVYPWPLLVAMYRQRKGRTPSQLYLRRTDQEEHKVFGLTMKLLPEHEALIREIKSHIKDRWEVDPDFEERGSYL